MGSSSSDGSQVESDPGSDPYLSATLSGFLDQLAARTPAPGGGSVASIACAMAAGLVEMASAFDASGTLDQVGARAHELRGRAAALAEADGRAYAGVLAALRMPAGPERTRSLDAAVAGAIECPMKLLEIAAEVATLAADVAARGNRNLEGDAITGALLAEAAARGGHPRPAERQHALAPRDGGGAPRAAASRPGLRHPRAGARGRGVRARRARLAPRRIAVQSAKPGTVPLRASRSMSLAATTAWPFSANVASVRCLRLWSSFDSMYPRQVWARPDRA